jgi:hypothetical protein
MLRISFSLQDRQHGSRAFTRRLRACLYRIVRPQITLRVSRAEIEKLPALGSVLVRLTRSHHMQRRFGHAVGNLIR